MSASFPTTQWSIIERIRRSTDPESKKEAYGNLYRHYWPPLYAFACRSGLSHEESLDLIHDFFLRAMQNDTFSRADALKGKLRTFLLAVFKAGLIDQSRAGKRLKRGGQIAFQSLDAPGIDPGTLTPLPANELPPQDLYDFIWAKTLLDRCFEILRDEHLRAGRGELFERLHPALTEPAATPEETAKALGMSESAYRVALLRMRRRFGQLVRSEVAATIPRGSSVEEELANLKRILESGQQLLD